MLTDPAGKTMVSAQAQIAVEPLKEPVANYVLAVESPKLWSVDEPALYSVRTVVKRDGMVTVTFPRGDGARIASVVIEAAAQDAPAGLGGIVTVE